MLSDEYRSLYNLHDCGSCVVLHHCSQEVKVGAEYQAIVPDYAPTTPYPSAAKALDRMVWTPSGTTDRDGKELVHILVERVGLAGIVIIELKMANTLH